MKYLWLCLSFMVIGCNHQPYLQSQLQQSVSAITKEREPLFSTGYTDLNNDGLEDALVYLEGAQWCGSGGCTLMVFESLGDSYKFISKSTVTRTPISVAATTSNGWKDFIVWSRGTGFVLMRYDGNKYPHNPSLEAPVGDTQVLGARLVIQ
tara:strand:+ start:1966 stop:2418 length:453 start_codon:yes stop_codon:yes gene_type:complete